MDLPRLKSRFTCKWFSASEECSSSRRSKILLVANYESDVGYAWWLMENFWHVISSSAVSSGRSCLLVYPKIGSIPELIRSSPITVSEFRFNLRSYKDVWRGLTLIRREKITSIYLTDWHHLHWAYLLWRLAGVTQIVLHVHTSAGDNPPVTGPRRFFKDILHFLGMFSATRYIAVSHHVASRLERNCRVPARRCIVVTNGIQLFDPDATDRDAVRDRIGVARDAILIVLVSRATFSKGIDFAVNLMSRVLQDPALRRTICAVHCGDGPDLYAFAQLAEEKEISSNFRFLGRRNDVQDIISAADIALHPSRGEAMSLAILEFMCAKLAVLASDLPSVCSAIHHGVDGLTYQHENLDSAEAALRQLIHDSALRKSLGEAAAASCRSKYSLETMNRTFVQEVIPALNAG